MVTGIMLSSHGFLSFVLNVLILELMNPENEEADVIVREGN